MTTSSTTLRGLQDDFKSLCLEHCISQSAMIRYLVFQVVSGKITIPEDVKTLDPDRIRDPASKKFDKNYKKLEISIKLLHRQIAGKHISRYMKDKNKIKYPNAQHKSYTAVGINQAPEDDHGEKANHSNVQYLDSITSRESVEAVKNHIPRNTTTQ